MEARRSASARWPSIRAVYAGYAYEIGVSPTWPKELDGFELRDAREEGWVEGTSICTECRYLAGVARARERASADAVEETRLQAVEATLQGLAPSELLRVLRTDGHNLDPQKVAPCWPVIAKALGDETHEIVTLRITRRLGTTRWAETNRLPAWLATNAIGHSWDDDDGGGYVTVDGFITREGNTWTVTPRSFGDSSMHLTGTAMTANVGVPRGTPLQAELETRRRGRGWLDERMHHITFTGCRSVQELGSAHLGECAIALAHPDATERPYRTRF